MRKLWILGFLLLMASAHSATEEVILRLHGSNTIGASLTPTLAKHFLQRQGAESVSQWSNQEGTEFRVTGKMIDGSSQIIEIQALGSGTAFKSMAAGTADIGAASRPIKDKEQALLTTMGDMRAPGREHVLGLDGIAIIVNQDNPLTELDMDTLRQVFSGEIQDWSKLDGNAGKIQVLARDDESGTYDTFKSLLLNKETQLRDDAQRFSSNDQLSAAVAADPLSIGFVALSAVGKNRALAVAEGKTTAVGPATFSVATEDYPLSRRLFLYTPLKSDNPYVTPFLEFALAQEGQGLLGETGFISLNVFAAVPEPRADAPKEYLKLTANAQRLSMNIRFLAGSRALDNKALKDMDRLTAFMTQADNSQQGLLLLGFSDNHEAGAMSSLALSEHRADAVAHILAKHDLYPVAVRGFGSLLPVASNATERGRAHNRRVELWLR